MHNNMKIFCMHDPPLLLKNTRSNLEKYVFAVKQDQKKHVKWTYIKQFYDHDSALPIRKAPKLTRGYFELTSFSKMRVNKAAQVLSHTVAAGVYTYTTLGRLPAEAVHTAEFIETIDSLFDSLNSRYFKDIKTLRRPMSTKSGHAKFVSSCVPMLTGLTVVGSRNIQFIKGLLLAIACVSKL